MQMLKRMEATHGHRSMNHSSKRLKVFYGFSKINKIQKREAIAVFFENEVGAGGETQRSHKTLIKLMNVVCERWQSPEEALDAEMYNRVFTAYYIFLDDKRIGGSLEKALAFNFNADKNHVGEKVRKEIKEKLRIWFMAHRPDYKEPCSQMELDFQE